MRYLLLCLILVVGPAAAFAGDAVQTMATILVDLKHFPSDDQKQQLEAIIADEQTTEDERTVATALRDLEHRVADEDRQALTMVLEDDAASEPVQTLAEVLLALNHQPSEADKAKLRALAGA